MKGNDLGPKAKNVNIIEAWRLSRRKEACMAFCLLFG